MSLIYGLFALLDWLIYQIAGVIFNVIYRLAYTKIFTSD